MENLWPKTLWCALAAVPLPVKWLAFPLALASFALLCALPAFSQEQPRGRGARDEAFLKMPPRVGEQAPDFTAINEEGKQVKLSDFKGSPVVLQFGAYT